MVTFLFLASSACLSSRSIGKSATHGVFDAFKDPEDPLIRDTRKVLESLVKTALDFQRAPGQTAARIAREITEGVLSAVIPKLGGAKELLGKLPELFRGVFREAMQTLNAELPRLGPALTSLVSAAGKGFVDALTAREAALGRVAEVAAERMGTGLSRALARSLGDSLTTLLGKNGEGPLTESLAGALQKLASAGVRGLTGELTAAIDKVKGALPSLPTAGTIGKLVQPLVGGVAQELAASTIRGIFGELGRHVMFCPAGSRDPRCVHEMIRGFSASIAAGIVDGMSGRTTGWVFLALAFGGGMVLAGGAIVLYLLVSKRRRERMGIPHG